MEFAGFGRSVLLAAAAVVMGVFVGSCDGYNFLVGGRDGWVVKPREDYHHWTHRLRFQVNDTLNFKYNKESDSVLVVSKQDYDSCNATKPIQTLNDGDSTFKLDRSGPFYFITGNADNCKKGQKLIVVVLAIRPGGQHHSPAPPSPSPSPVASPPAATPKHSPSPSPVVPSPTLAPALSPSPSADQNSPSPAQLKSGSTGLGFSFGSVLVSGVVAGLVLG